VKAVVFVLVLVTPLLAGSGVLHADSEDARKKDVEAPKGADAEAIDFSAALQERERALQAREAEMEQAQLDLEAAKAELEKRLQELQAKLQLLQKAQARSGKKVSEQKLARLLQLIRTVEKMKPEEAAPYLDKFETSTAAEILHGMNMRKAAAVIANMNASKAAALSRWFLAHGHPAPPYDPKQDDKR
jgi:flagellar motility protein MotE (MotC chaperone)